MLEEVDSTEWEIDDEAVVAEDNKVIKALDTSTIYRVAKNCNDLAKSLEITAQWLSDDELCVISTKRNRNKDAWLALCKR